MHLIHAIILGIIEGLTEFLPISSTGHMILVSSLLRIQDNDFVKTFEIVIQLGAIMAVVVAYYKRFLLSFKIYLKLAVAVIPVLILGKLIYKTLKEHLLNPYVVCFTLIAGGIILILTNKWTDKKEGKYLDLEDVSYADAFKIGLFQCISLIPGVSRAAATIFGGLFSGFSRRQATEFSFLLAVPTMFAATGYDLLKTHSNIHGDDWMMLLVGAGVAFMFALLAITAFINYVSKHGFKFFGYYRIILGIVFLAIALTMGLEMNP
jgi:undecaprenyl-diphosphatase